MSLLSRRTVLALLFLSLLPLAGRVRAADEKIRIACVGDSITFGAGVKDPKVNAYPVVLGGLLGDKYDSQNFGVSGATLLKNGDKPYWKEAAYKQAQDFKPNIVVIKLGTNDTKPQNAKHKDEFNADLAAMVDAFEALPSKPKVFLCLPVPIYGTLYGINDKNLQDFVLPGIKAVVEQKKLPLIDLHTALSGKPELFPDKIHPNAAGAALIAKAVAEAIEAAK